MDDRKDTGKGAAATIVPDPGAHGLTSVVQGWDEAGAPVTLRVVGEKPLTLFLNGQEIVTMMTIGDRPGDLAVGYLRNQNMLRADDRITAIDYDADLQLVVVRTARRTDYEEKLRKKTLTSGCAQGTVFGDMMESLDAVRLPAGPGLRVATLPLLTRKISTMPSLYLSAGAIHGCVLCRDTEPIVYMEDVGRHNAVDKIAGHMFRQNLAAADKYLYTTGRLTSEMVIKTVHMGIPVLISRSGFTAWGVSLARQAGLTLIGRARGKRFVVLSGPERLVRDSPAQPLPRTRPPGTQPTKSGPAGHGPASGRRRGEIASGREV